MKFKYPRYKYRIIFLVVMLVVTAFFAAYYMRAAFFWSSGNYAKDAVRPIEEQIVKKGGVKFYTNGDSGRGSDNRSPWYKVFYEMPMNQEQATAFVNQIAEANGYRLIHASIANRGPITVADKFVDEWFYDYSSKKANLPNMQAGPIQLAFIVDGSGLSYGPSGGIAKGHSVVGVDVKLPDFK